MSPPGFHGAIRCSSSPVMAMLKISGDNTPPTQVRTRGRLRVVVTVRAGGGGGGRVTACGDGVADHDLARADQDFLDEQPHNALAVPDGCGVCGFAEGRQEVLEVAGELEVDLAVGELGVEGLGLVAQAGLAGAQIGHPGAELVEGQEVFLVGADQPGDRAGGFGQGVVQALALGGGRVGGADLGQAVVDLGADQGGAGDQVRDVVPDDLVEVVGADRLAVAYLAVLEPVVVAADAPVVEDLVPGAGGGVAAVAGIPAARAGGQALEQGRGLAGAGGELLVAGQAACHPLEGLLIDQRRDVDLDPVAARAVHGGVGGAGRAPGQPGDPVAAGLLVQAAGLAEAGPAGVGGVAEHAPDRGPVPAGLAGAGGDAGA